MSDTDTRCGEEEEQHESTALLSAVCVSPPTGQSPVESAHAIPPSAVADWCAAAWSAGRVASVWLGVCALAVVCCWLVVYHWSPLPLPSALRTADTATAACDHVGETLVPSPHSSPSACSDGVSTLLPSASSSPDAGLSVVLRLNGSSVEGAASAVSSHLCIGELPGRWGNHVYIIMMAVMYAQRHKLTLHLPPFPAQPLLQHAALFTSPCPTHLTNVTVQQNGDWWLLDPHTYVPRSNGSEPSNATAIVAHLQGYFQLDTALYAPVLSALAEYLRPAPQLSTALARIRAYLHSVYCHRALAVGVHIRRGDYSPGVDSAFRSIPVQWYIDWVLDMQRRPDEVLRPARRQQDMTCEAAQQSGSVHGEEQESSQSQDEVVLLLISDEADKVAAEFAAHNISVVTSRQVMERALGPFESLTALVTSWYLDWWLFGQLHVSATSHSTFSYTASMFNPLLVHQRLGQQQRQQQARPPFFFCPNSTTLSLTPFDPWHIAYYHLQFWNVPFDRVNHTQHNSTAQ